MKGEFDRLLLLLSRIADALEGSNAASSYRDALYHWQIGQGPHPDD